MNQPTESTETARLTFSCGVLRIDLPGLTAVRIDTADRVLAIDGTSGSVEGSLAPDWAVLDLRDGTYGDFHRLQPVEQCMDSACIAAGEHIPPKGSHQRGPAAWRVVPWSQVMAGCEALYKGQVVRVAHSYLHYERLTGERWHLDLEGVTDPVFVDPTELTAARRRADQ